MGQQVIPLIKTDSSPTTSENIGAGYPLGQHWFNSTSGIEYIHKSDGVWVGNDSYSSTGHTHDDRYYTSGQTDTLLNGKSNTGHTHSISDVINLQTTLDSKSNTGHTHSQYVLSGQSYVYVYGNGTPSQNAVELQAAYDKAKTMSPSSGNTIDVIVGPGIYTFTGGTFNPDTDWINIVGLSFDSIIKINGINVTSNNVILRGIDCGTNSFTLGKPDINGNSIINNVKCYGCIGGNLSFGYSNDGSVTISGSDFTDCTSGVYSFGYSGYGSVTITSSDFTDCTSGGASFGYSNQSSVTITSSIFTDCVGDSSSFGYSGNGSVVTITNSRFSVNGATVPAFSKKSATYQLWLNDEIIECTGNTFTITLPTAIGCTGKNFTVDNTGTGTVTLNTLLSQTINGETSITITKDQCVTVYSNGSNWRRK